MKLTLSDLTNLQNEITAIATINANNAAIEAALEKTLSRDGTSPDEMEAQLDMNSNRIINLPAPTTATEPVRKSEFDSAVFGTLGVTTPGFLSYGDGILNSRTFIGIENEITVLHGVGDTNPTIGLAAELSLFGKTISNGTFTSATFVTPIGLTYDDIGGKPDLSGGTSGQVLTKDSATDYDFSWAQPGQNIVYVADRTALKLVNPAATTLAFLLEPNRIGLFVWKSGNYSAAVTADTYEAVTIASGVLASTVGAWVRPINRNTYEVNWFRTVGATTANDTLAVKAAIEFVPSGSTLAFAELDALTLNPISATTKGHITILGNGATITCTGQAIAVPDARPALRVFARTQSFDVTISRLNLTGARLTTDTTAGTGAYGGDPLNPGPGYPSGIDLPIGRYLVMDSCIVQGFAYAGIEAHYAYQILVTNCKVFNCGYSGIHVSDTLTVRVLNNVVDDTGSTAVVDGYGVTIGTSYNDPTYVYGTKYAILDGNIVTRCKRKALDVHDAISTTIINNTIKGFGYSGIYAVGEGASKNVGSTIIANNHLYGDSTFLSGVINNSLIFVGPTTGAITNASLNIQNNHIANLSAPVGISIFSPPSGSITAISVCVTGNTFENSTFGAQAIRSDGGALTKSILVSNNVLNCSVSSPHIYIQYSVDALVTGNIARGTTSASTVAQFNVVTNSSSTNNYLNGVLGA